MPYLVHDADPLAEVVDAWVSWYDGRWLHRHAPARIVPTSADRSSLPTTVRRLRAGRWWPGIDELLDGADRVAPDEFVAMDHTPASEPLRPPSLDRLQ